MNRTFNCGIGFVLVVSPADADRATQLLQQHGQTVYRIGKIDARQGDEHQTQVI